jgi:O-antigen ligase
LASRTAPQARSERDPAGLSQLIASPGAAAFALLVPLVFLHRNYQPSVSLDLGSTDATLTLSDVAVLGCGAIGVAVARRHGLGALRAGWPVLVLGGAFLALILAATFNGAAIGEEYRFAKHLVTALKFAEYALLALAAPLVIRRCEDLAPLLLTLTLWSAAASVGAVLQFLGLVNELEGRRPGQREPSFVGLHDLAALSGATLAIALIAIALEDERGRGRLVGAVAGAAGAVGLVLSGALAGFLGLVAAALAAIVLAWLRRTLTLRRLAAVAAVVALVGGGILALREADMRAFLRFLGVQPARDTETFAGESYVQRLVLGYIGTRIFLDRPIVGAGWQASSEEETYGPFIPDARRRYPDAPDLAFPSPEHPWGVQNAYIQAGAELGIVGLALFLGLFAAGLLVAARVAARAPPAAARAAAVPILWLLVTMGVWLGLGLVAGIPLVGLHWLALGLAAAAPNWISGDAA